MKPFPARAEAGSAPAGPALMDQPSACASHPPHLGGPAKESCKQCAFVSNLRACKLKSCASSVMTYVPVKSYFIEATLRELLKEGAAMRCPVNSLNWLMACLWLGQQVAWSAWRDVIDTVVAIRS